MATRISSRSPIENLIFFDKKADLIDLLVEMDKGFSDHLTKFPPTNHNALAPISYTGFRWATQIDPLWNAYFLGIVLSISDEIEKARLPSGDRNIFLYRLSWDATEASLFDNDYNWREFMKHSLKVAAESKFVVICDISEFYPRLNHHRLENALKQLNLKGDQPHKIMEFLSNFSDTYSFGIPVGGPASRILSELLLNQVDRLLKSEGIKFCRFADDYHLFADNYEGAFKNFLFLSEKLLSNQGLQLQKAKTRIMSGSEFIATSPLASEAESLDHGDAQPVIKRQSLLSFSIKFDPYSPTAGSDYEALKLEIQKYDVISILKAELTKSRIHISLSRKIISAIRFIDDDQRDDAVNSLISNADLLYPIYSNVLMVAKSLYPHLKEDTQRTVVLSVANLIREKSHVVQGELNLAYAIRLVAESQGPELEELLGATARVHFKRAIAN
ncbi:RNA-directed DNA polymerase [Tardiphaga sp. 42S5]|uniref:RNA-directed DNA polymerase n=1 Tax=Tardiphaga sp. 42S5 TaxID=1404799 RepID=UPI002A59E042|nr:RNA-directed DNA polymerase [Tardiphaga sp. 42S5]WPO43336.1 RNA-directed DNA polymerase [Tardiphaga sp. 42S5]